jgi:hypothetical protein
MSFDVGRVRHLAEQMHRSEDDAGDPIPEDFLLAAAGDSGLKWIDPADLVVSGGGADRFLDHGPIGATETIDGADGSWHSITLDVNATLTFTGFPATVDGDPVAWLLVLKVVQDSSGGNSITWPASVVWIDPGTAPTLDTTANSVEWVEFATTDGGVTWYGFHHTSGVASLALDDLTDVTITSVTTGDRLRYNGTDWSNSAALWVPVMVEDGATGLWYVTVTGDGDAVMTEVT